VAEVTLGLPETTSLLGVPLFPPTWQYARFRLEKDLDQARQAVKRAPDDPEALIWLGRRTAFLWQFRDALEIFSQGIERWPEDPRFYRHRGHRLLNLRRFDEAIADLTRAEKLMKARPDEVELDGRKDAPPIPTFTLHTAVWYHLGIARFANGEFEPARQAFASFLAAAKNDDARMIATEWLYITLRRMGRDSEAKELLASVRPDVVLTDGAEFRDRLLFYRGERSLRDLLGSQENEAQVSTYGFGVGEWYLAEGRKPEAEAMFRRVVAGQMWAVLPLIAAEAELVRMSSIPASPPASPRAPVPPSPGTSESAPAPPPAPS
jgi:tetratricopeptide (TPR) repeat protein